MKKHVYSIDQQAGEYPLPVAGVGTQVEYYAQGWFRTRYFLEKDLESVRDIFTQMSQIFGVDDVEEFFREKYVAWKEKWSVNCYVRGIFSEERYFLNKNLVYKALPWVINFELTKILEEVSGEQKHKNLAMGIIRCSVAYAVNAVPGD